MKQRISPATAISLVALFFSFTGAGFAASRYLITSKSQIKPSVLRALRGHRGPQGRPGATGPQGPVGAPGSQGPAGTTVARAAQAPDPRIGISASCAAANITYAGFGSSPQTITLVWTANGTTVKTQNVQTVIPGGDNSVNVISVAPPAVAAGTVLGLTASWTYAGGGTVGPVPVVSYC